INAGMNINYLVHNTIWVPGHFHLTVGTAVALTFMAVTYWLLPQLTDKELGFGKLATVQPYMWFVGVALFSNALHRAGLKGVPRRTATPEYPTASFSYDAVAGSLGEIRFQVAIGGTLMFLAVLSFLAVVIRTWVGDRDGVESVSLPPALSGPENGPKVLENIWLWFGVAVLLVLIAYGVPLADFASNGLLAPG
ncbi:MAG: cbb3-type cytochrome c oxidase subunit I, partial [Halobacteria archaeon]|nr:cbb3-type cytochrome c oxidase subunit I [Halobacteria archaeon]